MENQIIEQVARKVDLSVEKAMSLAVLDTESKLLASDLLKLIKGGQKEVKATFDESVEKAYDAHKSAVATRAKFLDPLLQAEKLVKKKLTDYEIKIENERIAEQKRLIDEAERVAEIERKRIEAEAEKAIESGDEKKAEELIRTAECVETIIPVLKTEEVKVKGQSFTDVWTAEVTDLMALVKAVAEGKAPLYLIEVNQSKLNAEAKLQEDSLCLPGVKVIYDKRMSSKIY